MNVKNIKSHLNDVVREWLNTLPCTIRHHVANNVYVTGGSIVSLLSGDRVNDYDLYFRTVMSASLVAEHYAREIGEVMVPVINPDRVSIKIPDVGVYIAPKQETIGDGPLAVEPFTHQVACITSNAVTLTDKIQLILRFVGSPDDVHKNFDFIHCTSYFDYKKNELVIPSEAATAILTKELKYVGSKYPLASIIRTRKFINRGWVVNAGQYLKMCLQLSAYDLTNIDVLNDQLMGVDAAYFHQMLSCIKKEKVEAGLVDQSYLIELINKFF